MQRKLEKKFGEHMVVFIVAFLLFWAPFSVVSFAIEFCHDCLSDVSYQFLLWLLLTKSAVDPFIYAARDPTLKETFIGIFAFVVCCGQRIKVAAKEEERAGSKTAVSWKVVAKTVALTLGLKKEVHQRHSLVEKRISAEELGTSYGVQAVEQLERIASSRRISVDDLQRIASTHKVNSMEQLERIVSSHRIHSLDTLIAMYNEEWQ